MALPRIFQKWIQNVLAHTARESLAKIHCCALWRAQRAKILPKYAPRPATTEGAVTRPATLPLAAYTTVDLSLVTRASVLHLMLCSESAWLMVPLACTVHSMAFHHSLRRMLASAQLHVCGAVVPCFVQSTALYLTPCSQLLNTSETREAEAQSK